MSNEDSAEATVDQQKPKTLVRSQYKDVMVKVEKDIYYLDRLQLALKSGYFEKLFVEDYSDKNCDLIEIPLMDTDTFSIVVDIIYGEKLGAVVNADNFVSLLMAMDYLQLDIDSQIYEKLVRSQLDCRSSLNMNAFKLYNFISQDITYEYLLPAIFEHLSRELENIQDLDEFLSIPYKHVLRILSRNEYLYKEHYQGKQEFCIICAKWICHDIENRLPFAYKLVDAAKFRYCLSNKISDADPAIRLPTINEHTNLEVVSRFFFELMEYNGEILCTIPGPDEDEENSDEDEQKGCFEDKYCPYKGKNLLCNEFSCNREPKLETFLRNRHFYDITVKAGEKNYQLHRSVLKSTSTYFEKIFSNEYSEMIAQNEGIPDLPSKEKIYFLDNIDSATFDIIVNHMYLGKVEFTSDLIVRLFKAVHILKINDLSKPCSNWMETNSEAICAKDVIDILNFTYENTEYKQLNRVYLSKYIVDSWPEIDNLPQFADLFEAITLPMEIRSNENKVNIADKVDQETFKLIINHIYFDRIELKEENIVEVLKASEIFKMEKLMKECIKWLTDWPKKLTSGVISELLRFACRNAKYKYVLNGVYFVKYMLQWPEIDNSIFCSVSFSCLKHMLASPEFIFDDPRKILDICSKWVVHDTKNRFCLIPQIALAISRNRRVDCNDCSILSPSDFSVCSQDFVKEKLWEILSTTSVLPPETLQNNDIKKQKIETPAFILSKKDRSFRILNAEGEEIASFYLCEYSRNYGSMCFYHTRYPMSATMMNDNVFIFCSFAGSSYFHAYNVASKKLFSLASDSRISEKIDAFKNKKYTLLNCRNNIYCCLDDGTVLEYSFRMNRWMGILESDPDKNSICFTSDGNQLYRIYKISQTDTTSNHTIQCYNFEQKSWVSSPNIPVLALSHASYHTEEKYKRAKAMFFVKNYGFVALFEEGANLLDQRMQRWRSISLPYNYYDLPEEFSVIGQNEDTDEMLCVINNKLYKFSDDDRSWQLIKEWPMHVHKIKFFTLSRKSLPFGNIIAIQKSSV